MEIYSYLLDLKPLYNKKTYNEYYQKMPEYGYWKKRKERMGRYKFLDDKIRCLGAGLLLQYVLKEFDREFFEVDFNEYGKPYLCSSKDQFNLSHSGDYAVCSYGSGDSGIDVEDGQHYDLDIAQRFFAPEEYQLVESYGKNMFFRLWTLKESYMKEKGKGLSIPLNSFTVCPGRVEKAGLCCKDAVDRISDTSCVTQDKEYNFMEFAAGAYHIAVCSKNVIHGEIYKLDLFC